MPLLETLLHRLIPSRHPFLRLIVLSVIASFMGIIGALWVFPQSADTISVSITAILLAETFERIVLENKDNIWNQKMKSWKANFLLLKQFLVIFMSICGAYFLYAVFLDPAVIVEQFERQSQYLFTSGLQNDAFFEFFPSLQETLKGLSLTLIVAFLFMRRGASLILSWFAVVWGVVMALIVHLEGISSMWMFLGVFFVGIFPYFLLELVSYLLMVMGGMFLIKALISYKVSSKKFQQVWGAVVRIIGLSLVCALGAVVFKTTLMPLFVEFFL